ncbi:MAG: DUF1538 domain-containing protein [Treponema sp.]|nr:DUF1538 domain-containing protein [Candidatus Treponema caballi]
MLGKLKENATSILPIAAIVLLLDFTVTPLGTTMTFQFLFGAVLTILGLTIFLLGADIGIIPIGEKVGTALTRKRNLPLLLGVAFIIGFMVTIAEPDVQVLAQQICSINPAISSTVLVLSIAFGIGLFVALGLMRTVLQIPMKYFMTIAYIAVFALAAFTSETFVPLAFDASGATTGPMTVPFIFALGMGVASKQSKDDSFGLTGIASIGPIMAVLILGLVTAGNSSAVSAGASEAAGEAAATVQGIRVFGALLPDILKESALALLPLVAMLFLFQFWMLHLPPRQLIRMCFGLVYAFVGLVMFLTGVNGGFMPAGEIIGSMIGGASYKNVLILLGVVIGAVVVCAEPAVWVLTEQVEDISGGAIKRKVLLLTLSAGVACAIGLAMARVLFRFSIWYILIPGYAIALILTFFCPKLFTAIAFDSGGVASGPMTSTFILSFTLGASQASGGNPLTDAFGVIALVAMTPLIAIQVLGLIYSHKGGAK